MTHLFRPALSFVLALSFFSRAGEAQVRRPAVDFAFAPATHLTAICFPADWQKTVVTERGSLGYDFAPGPYARPLTEIAVGAKGAILTPGEPSIRDPRVPIVTLLMHGEGVDARLEEFALRTGPVVPPATVFHSGRIRRIGGLGGAAGWAHPAGECDPAFRNVAWGTNRPVIYRVRVSPGSERRIALGFCEPYKGTRGQRVLELRVEGAPSMTIDALRDGTKNVPYVYFFDARDANGDGEIALEVHASTTGIDPNVILNAFWVFPKGDRITEADVIHGEGTRKAEISWPCGLENELGAASTRIDGILARFEGRAVSPVVTVRTGRTLTFDGPTGALGSDGIPFVVARPAFTGGTREGNTWTLTLPEGTREAEVYLLSGGDARGTAAHLPGLHEAKKRTEAYWRTEARLPFGVISVPDSGVQYVLDASIRDLYQIAESVDGGFQFQPGPSVYRGLWMHDASWDVSTACALGDTASARLSLETALSFQQPDGRIFCSEPFPMLRETPLTLNAMCRYARASGNTAWIMNRFASVSSAVGWIRNTRARTMGDPPGPTSGLFPPGFTDGGIGGLAAEYGTTFWSLNALRSAARTAGELGYADSARAWQSLADDLMKSFRAAANRDARRDSLGNLYLPMKVGDTSAILLPQQANWGMLDGQAFGHLFRYDDPLLNGTLAMMDSRMTEGIHQDVGWLKDGVWPFLSALEGIVHAYQRNYARSVDILYAVANHASPLGTWLEEQLPKRIGTRTSGDASDATAASLYILLLRDLIVNERADTLEVLGGVPASWYAPGARLNVTGGLTDFGPLSLDLAVSADGETGRLTLGGLARGAHATLRIVFDGLKEAGFTLADGSDLPAARVLNAGQGLQIGLARKHR